MNSSLRQLTQLVAVAGLLVCGCEPLPGVPDTGSDEASIGGGDAALDGGDATVGTGDATLDASGPEVDATVDAGHTVDASDATAGDALAEASVDGSDADGSAPIVDAAMDASDSGPGDASDGSAGMDASLDGSGSAQEAGADANGSDAQVTCARTLPDGIPPGSAPGTTCSESIPTITKPGRYTFSFSGASTSIALPCAGTRPDKIAVVYGLRLEHRRHVHIDFTSARSAQSGIANAFSVTQNCANPGGACWASSGIFVPGGDMVLDAGLHYIVLQTFSGISPSTGADQNSIDIQFLEEAPTQYATCEEAEQYTQTSCLPVPGDYIPYSAPGTGAVPGPVCTGDLTNVHAYRLPIATSTQLSAFINAGGLRSMRGDAVSLRTTCNSRASEIAWREGLQRIHATAQPGHVLLGLDLSN